ncbi:MAG: sulfite exporter TauE/SafE family protein [Alphaproteobacteria bacterium]
MSFAQCLHDFSGQYGLITSLFIGGLAGSFTHCAGMCAPFVLAQSTASCSHKSVNPAQFSRLSGILLLPYHLGRMTTYIALGLAFYALFNLAALFSPEKIYLSAPILMLAGTLFLISIFPALNKIFPWTAHLQMTWPVRFIQRFMPDLGAPRGFMGRYALGVMLGFMPCGLVLAAIMAASAAPTIAMAALAMAAFAIGTVPALILVASGGQALQVKFPKMANTMKNGAMALSALWLFILAGWMMI